MTHDDLEDEVPRHQAKLEAGRAGNTLKLVKETKDNGQEHHENGKQDRWQDALDDTRDDSGGPAKLCEPRVHLSESSDGGHVNGGGHCKSHMRIKEVGGEENRLTRKRVSAAAAPELIDILILRSYGSRSGEAPDES